MSSNKKKILNSESHHSCNYVCLTNILNNLVIVGMFFAVSYQVFILQFFGQLFPLLDQWSGHPIRDLVSNGGPLLEQSVGNVGKVRAD